MLLGGRALFASLQTCRAPRRAEAPDATRLPVVCQTSQGWYTGETQTKPSTGPLKAPLDTRQRRQEDSRRESNSQASTSQSHRHNFEFDANSQLGTKSKLQLGGSSDKRIKRGIPNAWSFDPRDLELLNPDLQRKASSSSESLQDPPSGFLSGHRSSGRITQLASKIFNRLLQVDDLTSDDDLARLANDIVSYLPSPSTLPRDPVAQANGLNSEMEQIIAQSSSTNGAVQESQLTQQELAELMLELRKLGGTRVALAVCDIIDGCGKGYATRSLQIFDAMLLQCDPKSDEGVVQDVFERVKALGLPLHVDTYNKGMLAYAKVDMCNKVEELAEAMAQQGVEPDCLTYRILIYAAPRSQGWPRALQLYREMCDKQVPRDEYIYHHLLEAFRHGNRPDLVMECTDWLQADDVEYGAHLYIPLMKSCVDTRRQDVKKKLVAVMQDLLGPMPMWVLQPFIAHCINSNSGKSGIVLLQDLQEMGLGELLGSGAAVPNWAQERQKGLYRGLAIMTKMANDAEMAWNVFESMQQSNVPVPAEVAGRLLGPLVSHNQWERCLAVYKDLCQQTVPDGYMYKDMMRLLAEAGQYEKAIELVHQMYEITEREEILQFGESQLASIAGTMGRVDVARQVLDVCQQHGAKPSIVTINAVLGAVQRTEAMPPAEKVQVALELTELITSLGMQADAATCFSFLLICGMAGDAKTAETVWDWVCKLPGQPNLYTYNIMIDTLEKSGEYDRAVLLFEQMRGQGIQGNVKTYSAMVDVYAARGDWKKQKTALKVQEWMEGQGTSTAALTYPQLIAKAKDGGNWQKALQLWDHAQAQQAAGAGAMQPFDKTYGTVIKACGKLGLWEKAIELKNQITERVPTRIVYNNLLMTLSVCNQLAPALELKAEMEEFGVGLDSYSYLALLFNACNNAEDWKLPVRMFGEMRRKGFFASLSCYTVLLECLANHGQGSHALQIFRFMTTNDTSRRPSYVCYEHVIKALASESQWQSAIGVYDHQRRMYLPARYPYYASPSHITNELKLHDLSLPMAATILRAYLNGLMTQSILMWCTSDGKPMTDHDNFSITVGIEQSKPQPPHMQRYVVGPVGTAVLETVVEEFLSVPNSAVRFTKRQLDPDSVQFLISKQDMKAWLQSVDVLSADHAPLSIHSNFEQPTMAQAVQQ